MKRFVLLIFWGLINFTLWAQIPQWRFHYFSQKEGLSNAIVTCWAQDSIGYVWVGTVDGLNRFDGHEFKMYFPVKGDSSSLPSRQITHLYVDNSGLLWVGTKVGITTYNRETDSFERIHLADTIANETTDITHLNMDSSGQMYLSIGNKLFRYSHETGKLHNVLTLHEEVISKFVFDQQNNLWVGLYQGGKVACYNSQFVHQKTLVVNKTCNDDYCPVNAMLWHNQKIWVGFLKGGIFSVDTKTSEIEGYPIGLPDADNTLFMMIDKQGYFWSIDYTGLKQLDTATGKYYETYPVYNDLMSIKPNPIGFFQDHQGNYWVIHSKGGVGLHTQGKGFERIYENSANYYHVSSPSVVAITEETNGNLWLGLDPPMINVFNYQKQKIDYYASSTSNNQQQFYGGTIRTFFRDRDGLIWLGTYSGGLSYFNPKSKRFESYQHQPNNPNSLPHNDVFAISQDVSGDLWMALHGKGVAKFNTKSKKFQHYTTSNSRLANDWTNHILCDQKGRVWVATVWGLSKLENGHKTFVNYFSSDVDTASLCANNITTLFEDSEGSIWVGTDRGLNLYNEMNGRFHQIKRGINNLSISSIKDDTMGFLWVSTLSGITRIDKKTFEAINFDESDGIQGEEFFANSVHQRDDGVIYFGGVHGVTVVDPTKVLKSKIKPRTVISRVMVDNKLDARVFNQEININKSITHAGTVTLEHSDKTLYIKYVALAFDNVGRYNYKIMLEGYDDDWVLMGNKTEIVYTNLSAGKYKFNVIVENKEGIWSEEPTTLIIIVKPAWYTTNWFKVAIVIFLLLLFWLSITFRTRQLKTQRHKLATMVRLKTEEISASNQELMAQAEHLDNMNRLLEDRQEKLEGQSRLLAAQTEVLRKNNKELKHLNQTKDRLFSIIAHDLLNPFTSIMGLAEVFKENYEDMSDAERKELATAVHTSSNRLFLLLQNLLLWARSQTSTIKFDQQTFPVKDLLEESTEHFIDAMQAKELKFSIQCDPSLCAYADVDMIKTVMRNLVNNAIKFTPRRGHIQIAVSTLDTTVKIAVADSGIGMDADTLELLFDTSNVKTRNGTEGEAGTGLGLLICKEFVERNHGTIDVKSELGKGTTFLVSIPKNAW